jgi:hypothetical protein
MSTGRAAGHAILLREKNYTTRDQICPVIALLEIEHKKFPPGKIFNLRSEKGE